MLWWRELILMHTQVKFMYPNKNRSVLCVLHSHTLCSQLVQNRFNIIMCFTTRPTPVHNGELDWTPHKHEKKIHKFLSWMNEKPLYVQALYVSLTFVRCWLVTMRLMGGFALMSFGQCRRIWGRLLFWNGVIGSIAGWRMWMSMGRCFMPSRAVRMELERLVGPRDACCRHKYV